MLGQFWQAEDTADEVRVIEMETWLDTIGHCSIDDFRSAWVAYQRSGPRTKQGKLYKPDAGAIYKLIRDLNPPISALPPPEPRRAPPVSKEAASEIIAAAYGRRYDPETGYLHAGHDPIKRFGGGYEA